MRSYHLRRWSPLISSVCRWTCTTKALLNMLIAGNNGATRVAVWCLSPPKYPPKARLLLPHSLVRQPSVHQLYTSVFSSSHWKPIGIGLHKGHRKIAIAYGTQSVPTYLVVNSLMNWITYFHASAKNRNETCIFADLLIINAGRVGAINVDNLMTCGEGVIWKAISNRDYHNSGWIEFAPLGTSEVINEPANTRRASHHQNRPSNV